MPTGFHRKNTMVDNDMFSLIIEINITIGFI